MSDFTKELRDLAEFAASGYLEWDDGAEALNKAAVLIDVVTAQLLQYQSDVANITEQLREARIQAVADASQLQDACDELVCEKELSDRLAEQLEDAYGGINDALETSKMAIIGVDHRPAMYAVLTNYKMLRGML